MKGVCSKKMPWALLSMPMLLLMLCPACSSATFEIPELRQKAIADKNVFSIPAGKGYLESHLNSTLAERGLGIQRAKFVPTIVDGYVRYCYYFDFEDDNGYAVFDDEGLYRFVKGGDFPWIFERDVYYDLEGGFLAYDDQVDCLRKVDDLTGNTLDDIYPVCLQKSAYSSIDGCIKSAELSSYIAAVHPTWTLAYTTIMQDYSKRRMNTNSYYYQEKLFEDGNPEGSYSEGNCGPNAMYSFLYNLPTVSSPSGTNYQYCNNLINGRRVTPRRQYFLDGLDVFSDALSDNVYYLDENGNYQTSPAPSPKINRVHWHLQPSNMPVWSRSDDLYWQVRAESIERGYDPRYGFSMYDHSEAVLETILNSYYGHSANIYRTEVLLDITSNIVYGIPVVMSTNGSLSYSNHGMVVYGYKRYTYNETVNGASVTKSAYMLLVDDGWAPDGDPNQRWFDPNRTSINRFFCTDRNSLTWPSC